MEGLTMVEKKFVTYPIAKALKSLGYIDDSFAIYRNRFDDFGITLISEGIKINGSQSQTLYHAGNTDMHCLAPLWSDAIDWLRDVKKINISIDHDVICKWFCSIMEIANTDDDYLKDGFISYNNEGFETYYEAREHTILKIIRNFS